MVGASRQRLKAEGRSAPKNMMYGSPVADQDTAERLVEYQSEAQFGFS